MSLALLGVVASALAAASDRVQREQVLIGVELGFALDTDHRPELMVAAQAAAMLVAVDPFSPYPSGPEFGVAAEGRLGTRSRPSLVVGARSGYVQVNGALDCSGYLTRFALDATVLGAFSLDGRRELRLGAAGAAGWIGTAEVDAAVVEGGGSAKVAPNATFLLGAQYPFFHPCFRD